MAAHMMGHSLTIHIKTYQAWIGDDPYRKAYKHLSNRADRPMPPIVEQRKQIVMSHPMTEEIELSPQFFFENY
jgi:hypothetical protein